MKTIRLYGDLQRFKSEWLLDVRTPAEALRAIDANRPGFLSACDAGEYIAILVDVQDESMCRQVTLANASAPWGDEILFITPRAGGDIPAVAVVAAFSAIGVTGLTATSLVVLAVTAIINIGLSLALSALANVITGKKEHVTADRTEAVENKPSFISNGAVNTVRAGHPYPLLVGNFRSGSIVLSSQIYIEDIPL